MTTLTVFRDLVAKYPSWAELSAWLTSKEGGSLRVVNAVTEGGDPAYSRYAIVRYDKKTSDMKAAHVGAFRSVVWDTEANRPVCVAPVKGERGLPVDVAVRISDFVDGVMVNVWKGASAPADEKALLATRTALGASGRFYSERSFAQLFADVQGVDTLSTSLGASEFVSVVLQHPEHRIVQPVSQASMTVVMTGSIAADGTVTLQLDPSAWAEPLRALAPRQFAPSKTFKKPAEALSEVQTQAYLETAGWQGLVFQETGGLGRRWRVRNSTYVMLRGLRGGEPTVKARFARLRAAKQAKAYLKYYTDETAAFWDCEQQLRTATTKIFEYYGKLHKSKEVTWQKVPVSLRAHLYALHGKYVKELREKKQTVTREVVVEYVNTLPAEQMYGLLREHRPPTDEEVAAAEVKRAERKAKEGTFSAENPMRASPQPTESASA
jgi:hypothetical protein